MFCKNCSNPMDDAAVVCVKCGAPRGQGNNFCASCGKPVTPGSAFCMSCGAPSNFGASAMGQQKSALVAGLLGIFLGGLGIHNFYLGFTKIALIQLLVSTLTCGVGSVPMAIWGFVEGILILSGKRPFDANGVPLKD